MNEWIHTKDLPPEQRKVYNYSFNASSSLVVGYWGKEKEEDKRISPSSQQFPVEGRILWRFLLFHKI